MFKGLDKFTEQLKASVRQVEANVVDNLKFSLKMVEDTSQSYVPIKTKALYNSFYSYVDTDTKGKIIGYAGYNKSGSGEVDDYAWIMHEGVWPDDFWDGNAEYLNGTAINYNTAYQATPQAFFLDKGFFENEPQIWQVMETSVFKK